LLGVHPANAHLFLQLQRSKALLVLIFILNILWDSVPLIISVSLSLDPRSKTIFILGAPSYHPFVGTWDTQTRAPSPWFNDGSQNDTKKRDRKDLMPWMHALFITRFYWKAWFPFDKLTCC